VSLPEQSAAPKVGAKPLELGRSRSDLGWHPRCNVPRSSEHSKEDAMKTETSNTQLFRSSRRWSPIPFVLSGLLLVAGYVGASAVLIDSYTNHTAQVGGPRA
jgi:hypothetical protein